MKLPKFEGELGRLALFIERHLTEQDQQIGALQNAGGGGELFTGRDDTGFGGWAPGADNPMVQHSTSIAISPTICNWTKFIPPRDMTIRSILSGRASGSSNPATHTGGHAIYGPDGTKLREEFKTDLWVGSGTLGQIGFTNLTDPYEAEGGIPIYIACRSTLTVSLLGATLGNAVMSVMSQPRAPFNSGGPPYSVNIQRWEYGETTFIQAFGGLDPAPVFPPSVFGLGLGNVNGFANGQAFYVREDIFDPATFAFLPDDIQ